MQAHDKALELDPECTHATVQSASAMLDLSQPQQAAQRHLSVTCTSILSFSHGLQSVQAHDRALELDPECTHAMVQSASAMLDLGQPQQAAQRYEQALARRPDWPPALHGCAAAQLQCARRDLAEGCPGEQLAYCCALCASICIHCDGHVASSTLC